MNNNFIYFIVDSARYYSNQGKDDRDKLKMMYEFENDSMTPVEGSPLHHIRTFWHKMLVEAKVFMAIRY